MKKIGTKLLQFILILGLSACGEKIPPISERIKKVYTAQSVTHDGITVYTKGGSTNIVSEYSSYSLNLSTESSVTLRDVTGETFAGSYSVSGNTLTLTGLNPQPTGSGGTLTYDITEISEDGKSLILTATKASPKTSNTINVYTLTAP